MISNNDADNKTQETTDKTNTRGGFDEILLQLDTLIGQLEENDVPLEESLAAFEKGISLTRQGQKILDAAERKVEILLQDGSLEQVNPEKMD